MSDSSMWTPEQVLIAWKVSQEREIKKELNNQLAAAQMDLDSAAYWWKQLLKLDDVKTTEDMDAFIEQRHAGGEE